MSLTTTLLHYYYTTILASIHVYNLYIVYNSNGDAV